MSRYAPSSTSILGSLVAGADHLVVSTVGRYAVLRHKNVPAIIPQYRAAYFRFSNKPDRLSTSAYRKRYVTCHLEGIPTGGVWTFVGSTLWESEELALMEAMVVYHTSSHDLAKRVIKMIGMDV